MHSNCFRRLRCLLCRLLPCEPCRLYYAHAWSVLDEPEDVVSSFIVPRECAWVHSMHASVAHKVAGAEGIELPAPDQLPSVQEWYRRVVTQNGSGVSCEALLDSLLYMAKQIECDNGCKGRAEMRCACFVQALRYCSILFRDSRLSKSIQIAGSAIDKALRVLKRWSAANKDREQLWTVDQQIAACVAAAVLVRHIYEGESDPNTFTDHGLVYKACIQRVDDARGSLPKWIMRNHIDQLRTSEST